MFISIINIYWILYCIHSTKFCALIISIHFPLSMVSQFSLFKDAKDTFFWKHSFIFEKSTIIFEFFAISIAFLRILLAFFLRICNSLQYLFKITFYTFRKVTAESKEKYKWKIFVKFNDALLLLCYHSFKI